jgi:hypothetical protein
MNLVKILTDSLVYVGITPLIFFLFDTISEGNGNSRQVKKFVRIIKDRRAVLVNVYHLIMNASEYWP